MRWMLLLCAWALSAATPPDPAGWQSLYREDFERGVLTGWTGGLENFQVRPRKAITMPKAAMMRLCVRLSMLADMRTLH